MKDKRTYKTRKEHSHDMSYENEASITNEGKRTYKVIKNIPEENVVIMEDRGELDLTLLLEQHKKEIWEWKQKEAQWIRDKNQLEGNKKIIEELSSQARVKRLDDSLANALEINEDHQRYNGKLQKRLTEVEEDNKKLAKQIEDINKNRVVL